MKKTLTISIFIFVIALIIGILYLSLTESELDKTELLNYLKNNIEADEGYNYSIKVEKDIDDRHIILFTFDKKGTNDMIGIAVFKSISNGKYKYEKYFGGNQNTNVCAVNTKNAKSQNLSYTVFYGIIMDGYPNKYRIISNGKETIEEFKLREFFIRYYPIKDDDQGTKILQIK